MKDFVKRQHGAGTLFFVWLNTTHMHLYTQTKPESLGQAGRWQSPYHDAMIDHDRNVGKMLTTRLRLPKLFNLRTDPYERADQTSNTYYNWYLEHDYLLFVSWTIVDQWASTFKEFPPIQRPNTFTIDDALRMLSESAGGGKS